MARGIIKILFSHKYILYTNVGISLISCMLGDMIEQTLEKRRHPAEKKSFDFKRNFNMTMVGWGSGLFRHYWYRFLDKNVKGSGFTAAFKKVIFDQMVSSPALIINMFVTLAILEKPVFNDAIEEFSQKSVSIFLTDMVIGPPTQFINFYLVPLKYRMVYDNTALVLFDTVYSYIRYKQGNAGEDCDKE